MCEHSCCSRPDSHASPRVNTEDLGDEGMLQESCSSVMRVCVSGHLQRDVHALAVLRA